MLSFLEAITFPATVHISSFAYSATVVHLVLQDKKTTADPSGQLHTFRKRGQCVQSPVKHQQHILLAKEHIIQGSHRCHESSLPGHPSPVTT